MADKIVNTATGQNAPLTGTYTLQATDHAITMGVDGEANSLFALPTSTDWLLIEVFFVEEVDGDLSYHEWTDDVRDIPTLCATMQQMIEDDSQVTYYKMTISHYDSNYPTKINVWRGENLSGGYVALCLDAVDTNVDFTFPVGNWVIGYELLAPDGHSTLYPRTVIYPSSCTYPRGV